VRQIGQLEERVGRHHAHALDDVLHDDVAGDVGVEIERAAHRARALELGDVLGADVPEAQRSRAASSRLAPPCATDGIWLFPSCFCARRASKYSCCVATSSAL